MIPVPGGEIGRAICEKYFPIEEWEKEYQEKTAIIRRISKYTGLNFNEVLQLPYSYFLLLNRESWINSYQQTTEGMELLKTLWRLQQTKADEQAIKWYTGGEDSGRRS